MVFSSLCYLRSLLFKIGGRKGTGAYIDGMAGERGALLADWPLPVPFDWCEQVNQPQTEAELEAIRRCVRRGCPYGRASWVDHAAERLGLQSTLRSRGRPSGRPQ